MFIIHSHYIVRCYSFVKSPYSVRLRDQPCSFMDGNHGKEYLHNLSSWGGVPNQVYVEVKVGHPAWIVFNSIAMAELLVLI